MSSQQQELQFLTEEVMEAGCGEIWKLIMEYKEIAEVREFVQPIVDKFKAMPRHSLPFDLSEFVQTKYCRENKIARSYNGNGVGFLGGDHDIMTVRIVFHHFNRKMPKACKLPAEYKKRGITWGLVRDCWDEEDKNLYLIATGFSYHGSSDTVDDFIDWAGRKGIQYTGMPQFIQMSIDHHANIRRLRKEDYKRQRELFVTMKLIP